MLPADERYLSTHVLVIGAGGAGLRAAIELADAGMDVLTVGKRRKHDAHTTLAAGGINAALGTMDPQDSWQQHAADTLQESYLLADPRVVETVARGAAHMIETAQTGFDAARASQAFETLLLLRIAKEEQILIPALERAGVDLDELLEGLPAITGE